MVFHWSLNDSKSPQVFRTLLSILVDLGSQNGFDSSTDFHFFQSLLQALGDLPKELSTIDKSFSLIFLLSSVLWQSLSFYLSFCPFLGTLSGPPKSQNPQNDPFSLQIFIGVWVIASLFSFHDSFQNSRRFQKCFSLDTYVHTNLFFKEEVIQDYGFVLSEFSCWNLIVISWVIWSRRICRLLFYFDRFLFFVVFLFVFLLSICWFTFWVK